MAKSANQKLKLLYLTKLLLTRSDEAHPMSVPQIIESLAVNGIKAERKSIYDDIEALRHFGLDIIQNKGKGGGYYIGDRDFELPELKLLVDSVQSSKFITEKKTIGLIKKIESLASVYDAQLLQRQVFVRNRIKSMNESVYYNVDEISGAITDDKAIRFRYFDYTVTKERKFRKNGAWYEVSPYSLMWDDENYYMLAFDPKAGKMKHYRVDKMTDISALEKLREGKEQCGNISLADYSKQVFGMFTGSAENVKLRFSNSLVGAVIDRFGRDTLIVASDAEHFTVSVSVAVSPRFYAWLFGFGTDVEILGPDKVRDEFTTLLSELTAAYTPT